MDEKTKAPEIGNRDLTTPSISWPKMGMPSGG